MPLPGVQVRLVDPDGDDALVGDAGEIWVQGPERVRRLLGGPRGHRPAPSPPTAGCAPATSRVVDDDGFLFLVDRVKDLIIVSGFNVYPAEVEEVLAEHPAVAQARRDRRAPPALRARR